MLDMVASECGRIESRFLEPACGDGNFLAEVLRRKPISSDRIAVCFDNMFRQRQKEKRSRIHVPVDLLPGDVAAMRSADAIKSILEEQGRSQRSLALDLGLTPQALDQRLKSKTMKVETLCQIAERLGYTVNLVPKQDGISIKIEG